MLKQDLIMKRRRQFGRRSVCALHDMREQNACDSAACLRYWNGGFL